MQPNGLFLLAIGDWGIPSAIISDRDVKFLLELWGELFKRLKVNLLCFTAYHPQTDGQSEHTNLTAEIALTYYLNTLEIMTNWSLTLSRLSALLNSSISAFTSKTLIYDTNIKQQLDLLRTGMKDHNPIKTRVEAKDALVFAQMTQRRHYDHKHESIFLSPVTTLFDDSIMDTPFRRPRNSSVNNMSDLSRFSERWDV